MIRDITLLYTQCFDVGSYTRFDTHDAVTYLNVTINCTDLILRHWRMENLFVSVYYSDIGESVC